MCKVVQDYDGLVTIQGGYASKDSVMHRHGSRLYVISVHVEKLIERAKEKGEEFGRFDCAFHVDKDGRVT